MQGGECAFNLVERCGGHYFYGGTRLYKFGNLTPKLATIGVTGTDAVAGNHTGTVIGLTGTGDNTANTKYNDLLAIWDAYNGTASDQ
jgi:hypothetical protein